MRCKNCGDLIFKYHEFYGGAWTHVNGYFSCFPKSKATRAEPMEMETDG